MSADVNVERYYEWLLGQTYPFTMHDAFHELTATLSGSVVEAVAAVANALPFRRSKAFAASITRLPL